MSICVIGAGIIGLSTAAAIQKREPRAKVTLVAEYFSEDTTSDIAAGHWRPYFLADPRTDLIGRWAQETYDFIAELHKENALLYGAGRLSGYELYTSHQEIPYWAEGIPDFRRVGKRELDHMGWSRFEDAFAFTSYYLECKKYLPVILETFKGRGGLVQQRKLKELSDLTEKYDVVVNCTGLGSYYLIGDKECFPVRGQVFKVRAPFMKHFIATDDHYILPNQEVVTLGGTHQEHDWRTTVDPKDSADIWNATTELWPALKHATVLRECAGLRPGRSTIRLETENFPIGRRRIPVVHNYGHGGSGITLHHGCAIDAASLAIDALHKGTKSHL